MQKKNMSVLAWGLYDAKSGGFIRVFPGRMEARDVVQSLNRGDGRGTFVVRRVKVSIVK